MHKNKTVLVFAPHHDDESIGMGGTICLLVENKCKVILAVVTKGDTGVANHVGKEAVQIREVECRNALNVLGVKEINFMRLPDHVLQYNELFLKKFISLIRKYQPDVLYLPHENEMDRDHRMVCELGREAVWLAGVPGVFPNIKPILSNPPAILKYEVWTPLIKVREYIDISKVIEYKKKALNCYKSQIADVDYIKMAIGLNMFRASRNKKGDYNEAFF